MFKIVLAPATAGGEELLFRLLPVNGVRVAEHGGAIVRVNFLQQSEAFGWNSHRVVFPRFHNFLVRDFFSDAEFSEFAAERGHVYPPFFEQRKDTALTIGA